VLVILAERIHLSCPPLAGAIPNREVKLSSAEDNARATVCENRSLPAQHL